MADQTNQGNGNVLAHAAQANDVVIIADPDHMDMRIPAAVEHQLPAMRDAGVKHLYLEHDPHDVTLEQLRTNDTEYGAMVRKAESLGIQIHEYDDRSAARAVAAHYPDETRFMREHDMYGNDTEALIAAAPNQERMREFLDAKKAQLDDMGPRNTQIIANIAADMHGHPGEKAAVMIGEAHTLQRSDVDEGLRARGLRTVTVEVNSPTTNLDPGHATAPDKPDIIVAAETGSAVAYKDPQTLRMHKAMAGIELPWKNSEPVADHPAGEAPQHGTQHMPAVTQPQNQR